jgi:hypothetical protein
VASPTRTLYLALDAFDPVVAQAMIDRGELRALGDLLGTAAVVETRAAPGFLVSARWPSMYTGLSASRRLPR